MPDEGRPWLHVIPKPVMTDILADMYKPSLQTNLNILNWLRIRPGKPGPANMTEASSRVVYLKSLGVHAWHLPEISHARVKANAQVIQHRAPSQTKKRIEDSQKIQLVCFLVHTLRALSNETVLRSNKQRGKLKREAADKVATQAGQDAPFLRAQIRAAVAIGEDKSKPLAQRHESLLDFLRATVEEDEDENESAKIREALTDDNVRVRGVLEAMSCLDLDGKTGSKEKKLLDAWRALRDSGDKALPEAFDTSAVPTSWLDLVNDPDRQRARKAFEACVMETIHKALQGSKIWINHSDDYRNRKDMLLSDTEWAESKDKLCDTYSLPRDGKTFLAGLVTQLKDGMKSVAKGLEDGLLEIDAGGGIRLPEISPQDIHPKQRETDRMMNALRGRVEISDILLTIDKLTGYSRIILGRRAKDENELVRLYGALMVHGMLLDVTEVAAMLPDVSVDDIKVALKLFEHTSRLHTANGRVIELQQSFGIVKSWGDGTGASADMMALDATLHLYLARVNPRRKVMGTGIYTTVLNSYPVIWHQHILQNTWQAGAAVHGANSYNMSLRSDWPKVMKLAVDTHGFTHVGMSVAKLLQIELCPQLAHLPHRKLFVPTSMEDSLDIPDAVEAVVEYEVSEQSILKSWDDILRLMASICSGRVTSDWIISRMGSAAAGDPVHRALDYLGKLLRSLFLCDYFTNPAFRREIHTMLNRGESVHTLQRAITPGRIHHSRGRTKEGLDAIASAHTLLTNIILAFNTMRLDDGVNDLRAHGQVIEEETLRHIGPGNYGNVNFRGTLTFRTKSYADHLIRRSKRDAESATN